MSRSNGPRKGNQGGRTRTRTQPAQPKPVPTTPSTSATTPNRAGRMNRAPVSILDLIDRISIRIGGDNGVLFRHIAFMLALAALVAAGAWAWSAVRTTAALATVGATFATGGGVAAIRILRKRLGKGGDGGRESHDQRRGSSGS